MFLRRDMTARLPRALGTPRLLAALCMGFSLGAAALAFAPPASAETTVPEGSVALINRGPQPIVEFFLSPSSAKRWGENRMPGHTLPTNMQHVFPLVKGECVYDARVVFQGNGAEERRSLNLCQNRELVFGASAGAASTGPQNGNPSFNLVNNSKQPITAFYASPSSARGWGKDQLGAQAIQPGTRYAVRLPTGQCRYDMRVVYGDRSAQERRDVDACNSVDVAFP